MLHAKPQGHWPFGSGEEDFRRVLPYMGVVAILVMWPRPREQTFVPPSHWGSIWNLALISPVVLEKIFENGGQTRDITQIYSPGIYYYKQQGYDSQQVPAVQGF